MKFVSIDNGSLDGQAGALLPDGGIVPLSKVDDTLPGSVAGILQSGKIGQAKATVAAWQDNAAAQADAVLPADTPCIAPIPRPGMILAAGLAYTCHLAEMSGTPTPKQPTAFLKAPSSVSGPDAHVALPSQAPEMIDYEGELACVFGRDCHNVAAADAMEYLAGYTVANDFSARDWVEAVWSSTEPWQARQTWEVNLMGKQLPGFTGLGPALVTVDELGDLSEYRLETRLNGETMQSAPLGNMIFPIAEVIAYFSRWYSFRPGDVLLTGTPAGVGVGRNPRVFIKAGDVLEVEIDNIGVLRTSF